MDYLIYVRCHRCVGIVGKQAADAVINIIIGIERDLSKRGRLRRWWESSRITFEFDEEKSMDYLIYVPRLNKGFPESLVAVKEGLLNPILLPAVT